MSALDRLYSVRKLPAGKVSILPHPRGGDWLADDLKALYYEGVDVLVSLLTAGEVDELQLQDEAEICQQQGIIYLSYPIPDRTAPSSSPATYELLTELQAYLERGKHVAVHCYMGLGRSATIAVCLLILGGHTPEQACRVLSDARGYTVPEMEEQRVWVRSFRQGYEEYIRAGNNIL